MWGACLLRGFSSLLSPVMLLSGGAVPPDSAPPAAPDVGRYTREPLASRTSSTDVKFGQSQHFVNGRDIPADWWRVFHSRALNALVEKSLAANPTFQTTMAALRAAKDRGYRRAG